MRWRIVLVGLQSVLLVACAALQDRLVPDPVEVTLPTTPAEALTTVRASAEQGRWTEALDQLEIAQQRFPEDASLAEERLHLAARWQHAERVIRDKILVGDAENQRAKVSLLDQWILAEPDDLVLKSRRIYWEKILAEKTEALTACSEVHAASDPGLARRCLWVASGLEGTPQIEERLGAVDAQLKAAEQYAEERRRAQEEEKRQQRVKDLLKAAQDAIQARDYRRALNVLGQAAQQQPDNPEIQVLREEAWAMISPQVEALVKLGDHLYLDEQLDAALATWRAALDLKPEDEDIQTRIDRAQTVLIRLDALRRQQNSAAPEPAPIDRPQPSE